MRVAIFTGMFREKADGVARSLLKLSESLSHERIHHWVFTPAAEDTLNPFLHTVHLKSLPAPGYAEYRISIPSYRFIKTQLQSLSPDVIHLSTPDLAGYMALRYAKEHQIPTIGVYHTHFPSYLTYAHLGFLEPALWRYLRHFYNQCDRVFAPTQAMADMLRAQGIVSPVDIWGRGVEHALFNPSRRSLELRARWGVADKKVIVFAGRLVGYKGLDVLARVYRDLRDKHPNLRSRWRMVIAGDGPARSNLQTQMPEALFLGHVPKASVGEALASSDIFFFPSSTETFGQVVMEALACGLPALVSDQGGPAEIVTHAQAGRACAYTSADLFTQTLATWIQNDDQLAVLSRRAIDFASRQRWDRVNQSMIEAYAHLSQLRPKTTSQGRG